MATIQEDKGDGKKENKPVVLKKLAFLVGEFVYLKTDPMQYKRLVTGIHLNSNGYLYEVTFDTDDPTTHYDIELSSTIDEDLAKKNRFPEDETDED